MFNYQVKAGGMACFIILCSALITCITRIKQKVRKQVTAPLKGHNNGSVIFGAFKSLPARRIGFNCQRKLE